MTVRQHLSQHEAAEELPLVTDAASVTAIEVADRNRTEEVRAAVADRLREHGHAEWVHEETDEAGAAVEINWDAVRTYAAETNDDVLPDLIARYGRPYPSLMRFRVRPDTPLDFAAGQYVTIGFDDTPRPYSVASAPGEPELEFCIRRVPGGRLTSDLFTRLDVGDEVTVRGPNGDFLLQEPTDSDVVFLATGTGVAPLKSMIEYTFAEERDVVDGSQRDVWLFLGAGWEDDLPYHDRFTELARSRANFHYVPTCSREHHLTDWDGETAYVQRTLMKYVDADRSGGLDGELASYLDREPTVDVDARIDPGRMEVYACGISAMVNTLVDAVRRLGVDDRSIEAEGFG